MDRVLHSTLAMMKPKLIESTIESTMHTNDMMAFRHNPLLVFVGTVSKASVSDDLSTVFMLNA